MTAWLMYAAFGAVAGVLAGLLGVGGGIVIVPMLDFAFALQGLPPEHIHHMALGTSLATIMFTSVSSFMAHHRRGAVRWPIVWRIAPGIVLGTLCGSWVAAQIPMRFLKGFFCLFQYYVAVQMLLDIKPKPTRTVPSPFLLAGVGVVIGVVSSLVGIGGGTLSVPFLVWCNTPVHNAIGTSAAIGFPIAVSGAIGYVWNGLGREGLPAGTLGFVHLASLLGIAGVSFLTAPLGAKLAHRLPVALLKRFFAVFLLVVATKMLIGLL